MTPTALSATFSPSVPLETPKACATPSRSLQADSNLSTSAPRQKELESMALPSASSHWVFSAASSGPTATIRILSVVDKVSSLNQPLLFWS